MAEYVLHPRTARQLDAFVQRPSHAVLLTGPGGVGKGVLARLLAERLLELEAGKLAGYPHVRFLGPTDKRSIGIEAVRELEHFMSLKVPGTRPIARVAVIEDAHLLTTEAQNALLKVLEEPPADALLVLTAAHEHALLPTIRSRLQTIAARKPSAVAVKDYFSQHASAAEVEQALAISGGLPGLASALLKSDSEHHLTESVQLARSLLQKSAFERLVLVDELSRRKELLVDVCYILGQMAHVAIARGDPAVRWRQVMKAAYSAEQALLASAQPKLVATNLVLSL